MTQPLPLRDQLKALENLQEIDIKVDALKKNKNALPQTLKLTDESLSKLSLSIQTKKNAVAEIEKARGQTQAAQDLNRDRLVRAQAKMDSVQNTNEFQAASKELEQLKKLGTTLDEQSTKFLSDKEALEKDISEIDAQLTKVKQEREAQASRLEVEARQLDKQMGELTAKRADFIPSVEKRLLTQYDRIRAARAGIGITPAVAGRCQACNMVIPPQQFIEIQKAAQLHSCPSCNRIVFAAGPALGTAVRG